jgi:PhnB protein
MVKAIPENYQRVMPYLILHDATSALEFYQQAFGAVERMRMDAPGGKIGHAEILIGDFPIMLADECPDINVLSPRTLGGCPFLIHLYVEDVDRFVDRALLAGAELVQAVEDKFYGDRSGTIRDPYGFLWSIATHIEDMTPQEMAERAKTVMQPA